ncbi:unnamed protein product [Porites evermanni]|uniref:Uncharacterized protein n=1 Tax=Porites evermanni TaxID=104178 RepID=A0ABN8SS85_9CNID|nr:unnamed protein product [Porites evermanni]
MARRIFDICIRSGIHLEVQWIPRTSNQQADYISRLILMIGKLLKNFFFFLMPGRARIVLIVLPIIIITSSPNIFRGFGTLILRSLRGENCLVVPPVGIVPRVLHYLKSQRAVGTLVVILSSNSWKGFQQFSSINVYEVLEVMLKSRADTTTKAYVRVIRKFSEWSKSRHFNMQLPFPLSVVSLYLFKVQQSCTSSSSVILAHAALKWLHSFVPSLDRNPLDSEFCRNIIESAKRQKSQPVVKKKPITTDIIRSILDIHNKTDANLKNLRIAALCSLAFAGFFRYDELCNIVPRHIEFHSD